MAKETKGGRPPGSLPTGRRATVRVKTARGRTVSSQRWLQRQLNDPYVAEAKKRGYRSRAAFKLLQLDEQLHHAAGHDPAARLIVKRAGCTCRRNASALWQAEPQVGEM